MNSIRVDGWRSSIRFDAAHIIPGHPKCGHLHGHTYALHAEIHGDIDPTSGFIMDFGLVKGVLREVADRLDHQVLIQAKSPRFAPSIAAGQVDFEIDGKRYSLPEQDVQLLDVEASTAEAMAQWVADELMRTVVFPPNVRRLDIGFDESYGKGAWATRMLNS